jgi:glycosyltransferase involved in cell wall biosynthesis
MLLLDLTHTSHTRALTGVQRVCRSLYFALKDQQAVLPVTHDPYEEAWRPLKTWEYANLEKPIPTQTRGARWPLTKITGRLRKLSGGCPAEIPPASGLLVPEIFSAATAAALPSIFASVSGPRVAIFHDTIALKLPEHTPAKTVARFPAYLQELLAFDGLAAVSEDSRQSLLDYWKWLGVVSVPMVTTIPLAQPPRTSTPERAPPNPPVVLSVGSIEGRKNHLALLEACESLWSRGHVFELHLIGLAQAQTGRAAIERIDALRGRGRPIRIDGPVSDDALNAAYARCTFTIYPSLMEGFGLPVLESLAHGKPCICSDHGAIGESAAGGGCLTVAKTDAASLALAVERLLHTPELRAQLVAESHARALRTWSDYARDLTDWMQDLPRRPISTS